MATFLMVCGLPGSGKTTVARGLAADLGAYRLNADEWLRELGVSLWDADMRDRVERLQWRVALELLPRQVSVVVEWGTWSRSERDRLASQARMTGARVAICVLDASDEELFARIRRRGAEDPPVQFGDVAKWRTEFEMPSAQELATYDQVL